MHVRLKQPIIALTLLLVAIAATQPQQDEPKQVTTSAPYIGYAVSAHDAQIEEHLRQEEAARVAAEQQRVLQEAEAARLAKVAATKTRASRGAHTRAYGGMPSVAQADALGQCECGGNPRCNTGNGFYGAFQFMLKTWQRFRPGNPIDYSYEEQRAVIMQYFPLSSWPKQFPTCYRKLHTRGIV